MSSKNVNLFQFEVRDDVSNDDIPPPLSTRRIDDDDDKYQKKKLSEKLSTW